MATIEELEGVSWGDPKKGETPMIRRCLALRRTRLDDFTLDDLRLMLGQQIGVPILLPRAVKILIRDPLAEAGYPGDLLYAVVRLPDTAWASLLIQRRRLADAAAPLLDSVFADVRPLVRDFVNAHAHPAHRRSP